MALFKQKLPKAKYRIIKDECWWTEIFNSRSSQYLFYDEAQKRYRVACRTTANKHKWEFTNSDIKKLRKKHAGFDDDFYLEPIIEDFDI